MVKGSAAVGRIPAVKCTDAHVAVPLTIELPEAFCTERPDEFADPLYFSQPAPSLSSNEISPHGMACSNTLDDETEVMRDESVSLDEGAEPVRSL